MRVLRQIRQDERGATAIEYGLIIALIFLAMAGGLSAFSGETIKMWTNVANEISTAR